MRLGPATQRQRRDHPLPRLTAADWGAIAAKAAGRTPIRLAPSGGSTRR